MTKPNTYRTDRNARQVRSGYYRNATYLGFGVTVRLVINGELANDGDMLLDVTTTCLAETVEHLLAQPGDVYDYSEAVSRTATITHEDSQVSVTLVFQPLTQPSLSRKATGRAKTAHYLQHLVAMAISGISTKACAEESFEGASVMVMELDLSGLPGYPRPSYDDASNGSPLSDLLNGGKSPRW